MRYEARVEGTCWAGYQAETSYSFDHKPTKAEVIAKAGDFQNVDNIELISIQTIVREETI